MPNYDANRPANWYKSEPLRDQEVDSWYKTSSETFESQSAETEDSSQASPSEAVPVEVDTNRRRQRTKIISLSVCVVFLLIAAGMAVWQVASRGQIHVVTVGADLQSSSQSSYPDVSDDESEDPTYDDFRDYFENYYASTDEVNIQQGPTGTGVTVNLEPLPEETLSLQEIYELVSPAVVGLMVYKDGAEYSWGTGVVFREDGYIITNTHILQGGDQATVTFTDGSVYDALLVGSDANSDISVLYIEGDGFPCADFGDSDTLRVGDEVIAIGNPLGEEYAGSMTNGIISAIDRNMTYNGHDMTLLQTNAALNEGNSGGPLINVYGQVIGITNMKIMSTYYTTVEGIGFAIPSTVVKEIADQLIEYGVVLGEPTIGIVAGSVSSEAMSMYGLPAGVYVSEVSNGSDALKKGLQVGDIILEVNGTVVTTVAEINAIKDDFQVGDPLILTIYRDGETFEMEILLVDKSAIY